MERCRNRKCGEWGFYKNFPGIGTQGVALGKRILYVGALWAGGTCLQRMRCLEDLEHRVHGLNTHTPEVLQKQGRFSRRVFGKLYRLGFDASPAAPDLARTNPMIIDAFRKEQWDVLWIDKGLSIERDTLLHAKEMQPGCVIVGYSPDDMAARQNQSDQFLKGLDLYDIYFTTKSFGVEELKSLGCKNAVFCGNAYDPNTHRPYPVTEEQKAKYGGGIGFLGAFEPERARYMYRIALAGFPVRVWGTGWKRCRLRHPRLILECRPLWGEEYAMAICSFDINLCFLRKSNRDFQTQRSVEIPACGAFMLAERTGEHLSLFEEGSEAEFFGSDDELIGKVKFYLNNPDTRKRISEAGRLRCLQSAYSNQDRMRTMLEVVEGIKNTILIV